VQKEQKMPDDTNHQDRRGASSNESEDRALSRRNILLGSSALVAAATMTSDALAQAQKAAPAAPTASAPSGGKPNILIIWGDDIGVANISAYSNGLMGYETPGIDRIGREGIKFLHYYGTQIRKESAKYGYEKMPFAPHSRVADIGDVIACVSRETRVGQGSAADRQGSLHLRRTDGDGVLDAVRILGRQG
jgi:hypothetical protein